MTTATVPALLESLVDDAGLFPPTSLTMAAAVERHRADLAAGSPLLTHRLLCPASRMPELLTVLHDDDRLSVGVIGDTGPAGLGEALAVAVSDGRVTVVSADLAVTAAVDLAPVLAALRALPPGVAGWVEPVRGTGWLESLAGISDAGLGAKLRCGGAAPAAFPSADEVAGFVVECARIGLPFKATAGLHRAVRGFDPADGVVHHGYLNLLVATARAAGGAAHDDVVAAVLSEDAAALVDEALRVDDAERVRGLLRCYGSCSTAEPQDEARALGLLP